MLTIGFILLAFLIYQLFAELQITKRLFGWPSTRNGRVYFSRLSGFLILGVAGLIIDGQHGHSSLGSLVTPQFIAATYWMLAGVALIFLINIFITHPTPDDAYPQLNYEPWRIGHFMLNSFTWLIYLFSYEWLLRGPLLTVLIAFLGTWQGIALNTIIYSLVHIVKGKREMIASIPVGIILCLITLYTHSFLAAFIFHGTFALVYEYTLLYRRYAQDYKSVKQ